jgi:tetraacyldisaccharide 4'-kinase
MAAILNSRTKHLKTKGIYFLYRFLQALGWPLLLAYFVRRIAQSRVYLRSVGERLGFLPRSYIQTIPGAIWLHAVSVGEVLACVELLRRMRADFPNTPLFVSVATLAGRSLADEKLRDLARVFYAPIDYVFAVRRVLRALQPSLVIVAETEIWPNLFREAKRTGCGLLIVNGRISDKAAPEYRRHRWFFAHVLRWPDRILAQSEEDARRYLSAGAPPERVEVAGNLKYDFAPQTANTDAIARLRPMHVWIAASTMPPDEDDAVIAAFQALAPEHPGLLLVLAPRKPERFGDAAEKLARAGVRFIRRTGGGPLSLPGVLLLDTIGELSGLFAAADVVFMGGTLVPHGGHNVLEPAFFGKPCIVGPYMHNFQSIADQFRAAQAMVEIRSGADLAGAVDALLRDPGEFGARARRCAEANRGAAARAMVEIHRLSGGCFPRRRRSTPELLLLWPLSRMWKWAGARRRQRLLANRKRLRTPVVSVGNITTGGTGKTPLVLWLSEQLPKPAILTRGYGRQSPDKYLILEPGSAAPVRKTGDEPQLFLRAGTAALGIGPNRAEAGRRVEAQFAPEVFILDDGFQHAGLDRDFDMVCVDALNPFGGGEIFPAGRLREPLSGLGRASAIVITRTEGARALHAIETQIRSYNSEAPIFHARTIPYGWIDAAVRAPAGPAAPAGAFCGLGNPQSFWSTLHRLGIAPVETFEFSDHHVYRPAEIHRMRDQLRAAGAVSVLTTEKDVLNLPEDWEDSFAPLRVHYLRIGIEVDRGAELLALVDSALRHARLL